MTANEDKMEFVNASSNFSDLEGDLFSSAPKTANNKANFNIQPKIEGSQGATMININSEAQVSTLDEPVSETIMRDLKAIGYKFGHVFFPKKSTLLLRDWDLWGPLSLCVLLSILLQSNSPDGNSAQFASLFALFTIGATVVTINTKLLSGKISFFQSICVLGYCLLPLVLAAIFHEFLLKLAGSKSLVVFTVHFCVVIFSCGWAVFASTAFLAADTINLTDRKALAIFPIFLFYFVISWLVILDTA